MKTMKAILGAVLAVGLMSFTNPIKEVKTVDVQKSSIEWLGKKVTGEHSGTIMLQEGNLEFDGDALVGGNFVMDMSSINVTDLQGEYKGKLEGHLKADDFFGVATFPTASYTITKVTEKGDNVYEVTGDMVIKGISKEYTFELHMMSGKAHISATIDRTDFGIKYKSTSFFDALGDKAIYDDFTLDINLVM